MLVGRKSRPCRREQPAPPERNAFRRECSPFIVNHSLDTLTHNSIPENRETKHGRHIVHPSQKTPFARQVLRRCSLLFSIAEIQKSSDQRLFLKLPCDKSQNWVWHPILCYQHLQEAPKHCCGKRKWRVRPFQNVYWGWLQHLSLHLRQTEAKRIASNTR